MTAVPYQAKRGCCGTALHRVSLSLARSLQLCFNQRTRLVIKAQVNLKQTVEQRTVALHHVLSSSSKPCTIPTSCKMH